MTVTGKCNDLCTVHIDGKPGSHAGTVPRNLNVGGMDIVIVRCCMDCGQLCGDWPLADLTTALSGRGYGYLLTEQELAERVTGEKKRVHRAGDDEETQQQRAGCDAVMQ